VIPTQAPGLETFGSFVPLCYLPVGSPFRPFRAFAPQSLVVR
jgi:hypothetical protein